MVFATLKDGTVVNIRVLGKRVVAPDNDILDVFHRHAQFVAQLGESTVLIESGKSCEVLLGN